MKCVNFLVTLFVFTLTQSCRYISGAKTEVGEHSFFSEASGSTRGLRMDSSVNNSWRLMPSSHDASSFPLMETRENSILESTSSPLHHPMHINSLSLQQQQQYSFLGSGFSSANPVVKPENQPLRPFFDEWPRTKDSWSDIEDERSNRTSLSTTQLSISIPMVSSAFSTTSSRSPNGLLFCFLGITLWCIHLQIASIWKCDWFMASLE